jgi:hypothetical protein
MADTARACVGVPFLIAAAAKSEKRQGEFGSSGPRRFRADLAHLVLVTKRCLIELQEPRNFRRIAKARLPGVEQAFDQSTGQRSSRTDGEFQYRQTRTSHGTQPVRGVRRGCAVRQLHSQPRETTRRDAPDQQCIEAGSLSAGLTACSQRERQTVSGRLAAQCVTRLCFGHFSSANPTQTGYGHVVAREDRQGHRCCASVRYREQSKGCYGHSFRLLNEVPDKTVILVPVRLVVQPIGTSRAKGSAHRDLLHFGRSYVSGHSSWRPELAAP